jgi:prepilin-type N-terminal cleavage/methylation domain-containing protein
VTRGFTLIELILVIVIFSAILGLSLPNFQGTQEGVLLRGTADNVVYAMRFARSRAVAEGVTVKMVFEPGGYQLKHAAADEPGTEPSFEDIPGRMGRRVALADGIEFKSAPAEIIFYPDGQIDPAVFSVTGKKGAFVVTTKEVPGHVVLLEEVPGA